MRDDFDLDELTAWGCPWHGIVSGGNLTTTVGGVIREWTQPDWGDCWLVKAHDIPAVERNDEQIALDDAEGAEWRNYALLTGWYNRQLYGKKMSAGVDGNQRSIFLPKAGHGWSVFASLNAGGSTLAGNLVFSRLHRGSSEEQTVAISQAITWPFSTGAHWDIVAKNADGSKLVIGLWSANAGYPSVMAYKHAWPKQRARAKVDETTSNPAFSEYFNRVIAPFQYVLLTIAGGTDEVPDITVTPSVLYTFADTEKQIKSFHFSVPYPTKDLYLHNTGSAYQYELVDAGSSPGAGYSLVQGGMPVGAGQIQHETESIVGVYFDLASGALKTVKVRVTAQTDGVWSYDLGSPTVTPGTFVRTYDCSSAGKISLQIDGTEVSKLDLADSRSGGGEEINQFFEHVSNVSGTASGSATLDGTSIYTETFAVSGSGGVDNVQMYSQTDTKQGCSGGVVFNQGRLRVDGHGMEYASGAFGLVFELNVFVPTGGFPRTIVAGGVTSVVTKARGSTIGTVSTSGGYVNYVYENIKVSHHPVTGAVLMNAGAWV
jgi:hypothetical protein